MNNFNNLDIESQLAKQLEDLKTIEQKTNISKIESVVPEIIEPEVLDPKNPRNAKITSELVSLKMLIEDYKTVRKTLLENVDNAQKIINSMSFDMLGDDDAGADRISAYSTLLGTINSSVKILTSSYKDISVVLLNLKKLEQEQKQEQIETDKNVISTVDLIEKLKQLKLELK